MTQGPEQNTAAVNVTSRETAIRKTVQSHAYQRSVVEVHQEFDQLDPQAISNACLAWKRAADELLALADGIKAEAAVPLSAAWNSPASPAAQQQLQHAEATARALASDCLQMAHATDYAAQYAQWYKDNLPSYTDSLATAAKGMVTGQGMTAGAQVAVDYLANLLSRYNEVIQILPNSVQMQLAESQHDTFTPSPLPPHSGVGDPHASTAGGVGGLPTGAGLSAAGHGTVVPGAHDFGSGSAGSGLAGSGASGSSTAGGGLGSGSSGLGSGGLGDPYAAGSSLAGSGLGGGLSGFDPNALGGVSGGGHGGLGAGLGAGALGATGLGAGGLAGGLGAGRGPGVAGAGGAGAFGGTGAGGAGAFGGTGVGGVAGSGMAAEGAVGAGRGGMVPMHGAGGGHGEGEEERERSTWLTEDDDVWGSGRDVPPPVITS